ISFPARDLLFLIRGSQTAFDNLRQPLLHLSDSGDLVHRSGHVVQRSGKWSTVPVHLQKLDHFPPESWTRSLRNRGPIPTGITGPIAPESATGEDQHLKHRGKRRAGSPSRDSTPPALGGTPAFLHYIKPVCTCVLSHPK